METINEGTKNVIIGNKNCKNYISLYNFTQRGS